MKVTFVIPDLTKSQEESVLESLLEVFKSYEIDTDTMGVYVTDTIDGELDIDG